MFETLKHLWPNLSFWVRLCAHPSGTQLSRCVFHEMIRLSRTCFSLKRASLLMPKVNLKQIYRTESRSKLTHTFCKLERFGAASEMPIAMKRSSLLNV